MTDMIQADEVILKTDKRGRVRTPATRREALLDEFERSGLSGTKFAELTGLKYQTLATWMKKRRDQRGTTAVPAAVRHSQNVRWLETVVDSAAGMANGPALVMQLPGGVRLEVADEKQASLAAVLVRALAKLC
jgi:hypothetical protein